MVKRKTKAKGSKALGRQAKLPLAGGANSLKLTQPSSFGEAMEPELAQFNAEPKPKPVKRPAAGAGLGAGPVKPKKEKLQDKVTKEEQVKKTKPYYS